MKELKKISYEEFKDMKLNFNDLTYERMVELWVFNGFSDRILAEKCNVSISKIQGLRKEKYKIKQYNTTLHLNEVQGINHSIREEANAIVAYAFRNGYLEDLHAGMFIPKLKDSKYSRINDKEMKKLMNECCEKMAELLEAKQRDSERYKRFIRSYHDSHCYEWNK